MGLVQREIEAAGISTVTLSSIPAFTASVGAPRVAGIEYPPGRPFGQPGDAEGQTAVLRAALGLLEGNHEPGVVAHLPFEWKERRSRVRWHPERLPPIARLIKRKPWLFPRFVAGDIPE